MATRARRCALLPPALRLPGALAIVWLVLLGPAIGVARGQAPPTTVRESVTDTAGVLDAAEEGAVERTLADARRRSLDLHVLFVQTTGGTPAPEYARDVAASSSMGGDDALLVVAFEDRTYALWTSDALRVRPEAINAILDRFVAPSLRDGDVPGAVEGAVEGVGQARDGGGATTRTPRRDRGGGIPWTFLLLLGLAAMFIVSRLRRARRYASDPEPLPDSEPEVDVDALAARANAALVRVDDELRDAEHEAGFAEAQFGSDEGAALTAGLERARAELQQAFSLRQRLDDNVPEPLGEQVAMLEQILAHATAAESVIQERLNRLQELRGLERDPAGAVAELRRRMDGVNGRIPAVETAAGELGAYAPAAASAVEGNIAEAQKRLAFTDDCIREAGSAADTATAARALRAGGAALAQAEQLLDAVEDLGARVRQARDVLPQELQEAEIALARAEDLVRSRRHVIGREARTRLVEARRHFEQARSLSAQDPASAAAEADTAERLADEAFELALQDSETGGDRYGGEGGGLQGFGWGLPIPIPFPFPMGGGIGWGGSSWGGGGFGGGFGGGGSVGGGSFGGGSVGGGRW